MNTRIARERCLLFGFWAFFIAVLGWSFYSIGGDELMAYDDALPGLGTIVTAIRGLIAEAPTAEQRVAILQSGRLLAIAGDGWNFAP